MTQDEIIEMAAEIWNAGSSFPIPSSDDILRFVKLVAEKALAEHAMRETQRLGQEIEQEPVAYIRVSKTGHVMACAKTGDFYSLPHKTLLYTTPPQPKRHELQAKGEHPAPCARHCEANAFQIVIKNLKAQLAQTAQEPVAYFHPHKGFYWAKPTSISAPTIADVEPLPLYIHTPKENT